MSSFIVYATPGSPYGRAVLAALLEKAAPHRLIAVAPGAGKVEPHISRNPFGKIPVLEHDGFQLYETQAILRYLDRVLPTPALTPPEPRAAARMDQVLNIADWYLFRDVNAVIGFERIVSPKLFGGTPNEAAIEACLPKAHIVFGELSRLLGDADWFGGDLFSLADVMVAAHMNFMAETPEWTVLTAGRGNLGAWLARVNARRSFAETTWERVADLAEAA